mgnify:CR=1 FL=1
MMKYMYLVCLLVFWSFSVKGQGRMDRENEYRTQVFDAYPTVEETARSLKTSGYNPFENPTGIWFSKGGRFDSKRYTRGNPVSLYV